MPTAYSKLYPRQGCCVGDEYFISFVLKKLTHWVDRELDFEDCFTLSVMPGGESVPMYAPEVFGCSIAQKPALPGNAINCIHAKHNYAM